MKLADIILNTGNLNIVSGRFKAIIDDLEPGIHEFHPLTVSNKSGEVCDLDYYIFRCGQSIGSVLSWKSGFDGVWQKTIHGWPHTGLSSAKTEGVYLSKPEIAGRHLFGNLFHGPNLLVFSDALMDRLQAIDLRYLVTYPVEDIDEPWDPEKEIAPWLDWVGSHKDWLRENNPLTADWDLSIYNRYRPESRH